MQTRNLVLVLTLLFASSLVVAQPTEITSDSYFEHYISAMDATRSSTHRKKETAEYGKLGTAPWSVEIFEEKNGEGRYRSKRTESVGRKVSSVEFVSIGDLDYCRENGGVWLTNDNDCGKQRFSVGQNQELSTETYTEEKVILNSIEAQLLTAYTRSESLVAGKSKLKKVSFSTNKVWISAKNLILKREYITGTLPTKIDSIVLEVYEYPTSIKIEAPIK